MREIQNSPPYCRSHHQATMGDQRKPRPSELTALERDEHVAEWIRLANKVAQVAAVFKGGRGHEGGIRRASPSSGGGRNSAPGSPPTIRAFNSTPSAIVLHQKNREDAQNSNFWRSSSSCDAMGVIGASRHIVPRSVSAGLRRAWPPHAPRLERRLRLLRSGRRPRPWSLLGMGSRPLGLGLPVTPSCSDKRRPPCLAGVVVRAAPLNFARRRLSRETLSPLATDPYPFSVMAMPANVMSVLTRSAPIPMHVPAVSARDHPMSLRVVGHRRSREEESRHG